MGQEVTRMSYLTRSHSTRLPVICSHSRTQNNPWWEEPSVTRRRVGGAGQRCTNPRISSPFWEMPCPDGPLFKNFNADLVIYIATTGVCVYS